MKKTIFWLQATRSFPNGAPQREEYESDEAHEAACRAYSAEWRQAYSCLGCNNPDCPQHGRG